MIDTYAGVKAAGAYAESVGKPLDYHDKWAVVNTIYSHSVHDTNLLRDLRTYFRSVPLHFSDEEAWAMVGEIRDAMGMRKAA